MSELIPIPGFFEPFSSLSHLLGAVVCTAASVWLLRKGRGNTARVMSLAAFCCGAVLLLSISGLYHLLSPTGSARAIARRLDHAAIFVLIASSFTPAHTILFRGWGRGGALVLIWCLAISGIAVKMIYFHQMPHWVGLGLYLGMGWLGSFSSFALWRRYGFGFVQPVFWGGLAYTIGCIIEGLHSPVLIAGVVQSHELLHVAVLIGLCCHWVFNYQIADGRVAGRYVNRDYSSPDLDELSKVAAS